MNVDEFIASIEDTLVIAEQAQENGNATQTDNWGKVDVLVRAQDVGNIMQNMKYRVSKIAVFAFEEYTEKADKLLARIDKITEKIPSFQKPIEKVETLDV